MKKLVIGSSFFLNALVIAFAVWLFFGGGFVTLIGGFLEKNHVRLVSQFAALDVQENDVVFLGDSITDGGRWGELFPDQRTRNRGIGGDRTAGVLARLDQVYLGKPSKVFLLIGTNDLNAGVPETTIVQNIVQIVDKIREQSAGTQVFVQSILPRGAKHREALETLNQNIEKAIEKKAQWIDLYPLFLDGNDGSIANKYSNDELHLNGAGYTLWRDTIAEYVVPTEARDN